MHELASGQEDQSGGCVRQEGMHVIRAHVCDSVCAGICCATNSGRGLLDRWLFPPRPFCCLRLGYCLGVAKQECALLLVLPCSCFGAALFGRCLCNSLPACLGVAYLVRRFCLGVCPLSSLTLFVLSPRYLCLCVFLSSRYAFPFSILPSSLSTCLCLCGSARVS